MARAQVPPRARASEDRRGHRFAAYRQCSTDAGALEEPAEVVLQGWPEKTDGHSARLALPRVIHTYVARRMPAERT